MQIPGEPQVEFLNENGGILMQGMKVKVLNPFLYAYPLEGIIVCEKKLSAGQRKYKVQFQDFFGAVWLLANEMVWEK